MRGRSPIKCVVWDLDHTLWEGILREGDPTPLRPGALSLIMALDERGFLQSIASRNDARAQERLAALGVGSYFLYPQLCFEPKSSCLRAIAEALRIGMDALAFLDDQPTERAEISYHHPEVLCLDPHDLSLICDHPALAAPPHPALPRRKLYQADQARRLEQASFQGSREDFLATLDMRLTIRPATEADLFRVEELLVRTHQLNTTGRAYRHEELVQAITDGAPRVLVCDLHDRFGDHGTVGLAIVDARAQQWHLRLLLASCRVEDRGIGGIFLAWILHQAGAAGVTLRADYLASPHNRGMWVALKLAGFAALDSEGETAVFQADLQKAPALPAYVEIR